MYRVFLVVSFLATLFVTCSGYGGAKHSKVLDRMEDIRKGVKLSVLEAPLFTREKRLELSPSFGVNIIDPYVDTTFFGVIGAYHFSNYLGIEGAFLKAKSSQTTLSSGQLSEVNTSADKLAPFTEHFFSLNFLLTPIYAKVSLLSNFILHYDIYLTGGLGQTKTSWESALTYNYGIGMRFFVFSRGSLGITLRDYVHREKRQSMAINKHDMLVIAGANIYLF